MNYGVIKFPDNFNVAGYMNFVYLELSEIPNPALEEYINKSRRD